MGGGGGGGERKRVIMFTICELQGERFTLFRVDIFGSSLNSNATGCAYKQVIRTGLCAKLIIVSTAINSTSLPITSIKSVIKENIKWMATEHGSRETRSPSRAMANSFVAVARLATPP